MDLISKLKEMKILLILEESLSRLIEEREKKLKCILTLERTIKKTGGK